MQIIEDKLYGVKFRVYYNYSPESLAKEFSKIGIAKEKYPWKSMMGYTCIQAIKLMLMFISFG